VCVDLIDPETLYVGLNDRDAAWHDVYKVKISSGERTLVRQNTEKIAGWTFDLAGRLRLAERVTDNGGTEVLRVDEGGFTRLYSCTVAHVHGARVDPVRHGAMIHRVARCIVQA
jgi:hypothetical protein